MGQESCRRREPQRTAESRVTSRVKGVWQALWFRSLGLHSTFLLACSVVKFTFSRLISKEDYGYK